MTTGAQRFLIVNADDFGQSRGVNRGVIETHERSSRSMYSDCQFVSEQVNCCVRSCYRYGTRFGHLYYEIKLNSKNLCRWIKPIDVSGMLAAKADVEALRT